MIKVATRNGRTLGVIAIPNDESPVEFVCSHCRCRRVPANSRNRDRQDITPAVEVSEIKKLRFPSKKTGNFLVLDGTLILGTAISDFFAPSYGQYSSRVLPIDDRTEVVHSLKLLASRRATFRFPSMAFSVSPDVLISRARLTSRRAPLAQPGP